MCLQLLACFYILNALDNLTVHSRQTISHAIDTFGRMKGDRFCPEFELGALTVQAPLGGKAQ